MPPPAPPVALAAGAEGAFTDPPVMPLTRGAEVGVARGPFGPVLALRGAGLGADIVTLSSCTRIAAVSYRLNITKDPVAVNSEKTERWIVPT